MSNLEYNLPDTSNSKYKIGDIVKIKGQDDVILTIGYLIGNTFVTVIWFDKNHTLKNSNMHIDLLELAN